MSAMDGFTTCKSVAAAITAEDNGLHNACYEGECCGHFYAPNKNSTTNVTPATSITKFDKTEVVNAYDPATDAAYYKCMDKDTYYFDDTAVNKYYWFACFIDGASNHYMPMASVILAAIVSLH